MSYDNVCELGSRLFRMMMYTWSCTPGHAHQISHIWHFQSTQALSDALEFFLTFNISVISDGTLLSFFTGLETCAGTHSCSHSHPSWQFHFPHPSLTCKISSLTRPSPARLFPLPAPFPRINFFWFAILFVWSWFLNKSPKLQTEKCNNVMSKNANSKSRTCHDQMRCEETANCQLSRQKAVFGVPPGFVPQARMLSLKVCWMRNSQHSVSHCRQLGPYRWLSLPEFQKIIQWTVGAGKVCSDFGCVRWFVAVEVRDEVIVIVTPLQTDKCRMQICGHLAVEQWALTY